MYVSVFMNPINKSNKLRNSQNIANAMRCVYV